jgi:hypothetical protein
LISVPFTFCLLLGLPALVGLAVPPRFAWWIALAAALAVAVLWLTYDGAFHNDPWPILLTPAAIGLVFGLAARRAFAAVRRARKARAGG